MVYVELGSAVEWNQLSITQASIRLTFKNKARTAIAKPPVGRFYISELGIEHVQDR
jgi:hypothetical protein